MTIPIQEMIDTVISIFCIGYTFPLLFVWWPLALIPINVWGYLMIFTPRMSDGCFGYCIYQSRWEEWNGTTYWFRMKP